MHKPNLKCIIFGHKFTEEEYTLVEENDGIYKFCGVKSCKRCGKIRHKMIYVTDDYRYQKRYKQ